MISDRKVSRREAETSLQRLALIALYREVTSLLCSTDVSALPCQAYFENRRSAGKRPSDAAFRIPRSEDRAAIAIKTSQIVKAIRERLELPVYRRVKHNLIEEYCRNQGTAELAPNTAKRPELHIFLDCILDESLTEFELCRTMFSPKQMNSNVVPYFSATKLISTVVERCPALEILTISSYYPNMEWDSSSHGGLFNLNFAFALALSKLKVRWYF